MKRIFISLILISSLTGFSQNIEIIGGLNKNNFFDFKKELGHYISSYNSDYGYTIQVGIENIKVDGLKLRFTLGYDRYSGELTVSDGGIGGGYTIDAKISKSVISLGVFPLNFKIIKHIDLNFGLELSGLIKENLSGTISGWVLGQPNWGYDLNENYNRLSSMAYFGLRGRIAYDFNISDKLAISPQYSYYLGLSDEFHEYAKATKSMRHYFCIGIQRKIK